MFIILPYLFYYYLKGKEQQRYQLRIGWALLHDSIWGDRKVWNDYDIFEMDINYYSTNWWSFVYIIIYLYRKIDEATRSFLKEKSGEVYHENVLKDSIVIGFTPRQLELRANDALNMDENEMWENLANMKNQKLFYMWYLIPISVVPN